MSSSYGMLRGNFETWTRGKSSLWGVRATLAALVERFQHQRWSRRFGKRLLFDVGGVLQLFGVRSKYVNVRSMCDVVGSTGIRCVFLEFVGCFGLT